MLNNSDQFHAYDEQYLTVENDKAAKHTPFKTHLRLWTANWIQGNMLYN